MIPHSTSRSALPQATAELQGSDRTALYAGPQEAATKRSGRSAPQRCCSTHGLAAVGLRLLRSAGLLLLVGLSNVGSLVTGSPLTSDPQEQDPAQGEPQEQPEQGILDRPRSAQDAQAQIQELFNRIEKNLRSIDDLLFEAAGSEDVAMEDAEQWRSWIMDSQAKSQEVLNDIDKLLEISQQMSSQSRGRSSSSQGQGQQSPESSEQGQSPLDQQRQGSQRRQEGGSQQNSGQQPEGQTDQGDPQNSKGDQKGGQQGEEPGQQGQPKDGRAGGPESQQSGDQAQANGERGSASAAGGLEPWGELPPRVQEIFSNQNTQDAPLLYRDWIDSYYRRVSREP